GCFAILPLFTPSRRPPGPWRFGSLPATRPTAPRMVMDRQRLEIAYQVALSALLAERTAEGHWIGELSTSALSTATAVSALALVQKHTPPCNQYATLIGGGIAWLAAHQNVDGG